MFCLKDRVCSYEWHHETPIYMYVYVRDIDLRANKTKKKMHILFQAKTMYKTRRRQIECSDYILNKTYKNVYTYIYIYICIYFYMYTICDLSGIKKTKQLKTSQNHIYMLVSGHNINIKH